MNDSRDEPSARPPEFPQPSPSFLVSQVGAHAAARFTEALAERGLEPTQVGILRILCARAPMNQRALSDLVGILPSQLVALLDTLEARGLVVRERDPDDRRANALYATEAGRAEMRAVEALTEVLDSSLFAGFSPDERSILVTLLERIVSAEGLHPAVHPAYRRLAVEP
ncbi:MAG: MarR family winged helix-turn-helix transcriptional regulator [Myxococcota bacterium]